MNLRFVYCLVSIFVCTQNIGCALTESLAPSRLEEGPIVQAIKPEILKQYEAFYIPNIEVYAIDGDVLRRVDQSDADDLAESFRYKLMRKLGSKYTTFPQPARKVAIIKIAISDMSSTYSLFQLYPGLLVPNAMRGGASIIANVVDSVSKKDILIYRDTRQGDRDGFLPGLGKWDGVEKAFDEWADELAAAVSAAYSK